MFTIAICDDEPAICSQLEDMILHDMGPCGGEIDTEVYYSGEELFEALAGLKGEEQAGAPIDLIFLDIRLRALNGVSVGKMIREELKNDFVQIVYISSEEGYAMELFQVRPLQFLIKPLEKEKVRAVIEKAMELSGAQNTMFRFTADKEVYQIPYCKILYFESQGRKVSVVTDNKTYAYYGKLSDVLKAAPASSFIQIHKSYVINALQVLRYASYSVTLQSGLTLPISRTYQKSIHTAFMERKGRE